MSAKEVLAQIEALPRDERAEVARKALASVWPKNEKLIDRMIRRLENPDVPGDVWRGIEEAEDGRVVEMETALSQKPPWIQ